MMPATKGCPMSVDRTAEEWGRSAMAIPGFALADGMMVMWSLDEDPVMPLRLTEDASTGHGYAGHPVWSGVRSDREHNDHEIDPEWCWVDPDDPATAGCLLALLQPPAADGYMSHVLPPSSALPKWRVYMTTARMGNVSGYGSSLGRACIAVAEALGCWPGGNP